MLIKRFRHQLQLLDFQTLKRQPKRNVLSESFGSRSLTIQSSGNSED